MRKPHLRGRGPHLPPLDQVEQYPFEPGYAVFTLPCPKRIRAVIADTVIADSDRVLMLHETEHLPVYYFPLDDVRMDLMTESATTTRCPFKGTARYYHLSGAGRRVEDLLWTYPEPVAACPPIAGYGSLFWNKVDHWYEEDEEVFVHARDPFRRVDCLPSRRRVRVFLDGQSLADSTDNIFLFETGLPTRYYLPREAVRAEVLAASDHSTRCPYKGTARYHHVMVNDRTYDNLVWYYPEPVHESARIKGRLCFYNERVDILLDGKPMPRPISPQSLPEQLLGNDLVEAGRETVEPGAGGRP